MQATPPPDARSTASAPDLVVADIQMPPTHTDDALQAAHIYNELGLAPCPEDHRRVLAVVRYLSR